MSPSPAFSVTYWLTSTETYLLYSNTWLGNTPKLRLLFVSVVNASDSTEQ